MNVSMFKCLKRNCFVLSDVFFVFVFFLKRDQTWWRDFLSTVTNVQSDMEQQRSSVVSREESCDIHEDTRQNIFVFPELVHLLILLGGWGGGWPLPLCLTYSLYTLLSVTHCSFTLLSTFFATSLPHSSTIYHFLFPSLWRKLRHGSSVLCSWQMFRNRGEKKLPVFWVWVWFGTKSAVFLFLKRNHDSLKTLTLFMFVCMCFCVFPSLPLYGPTCSWIFKYHDNQLTVRLVMSEQWELRFSYKKRHTNALQLW